MKTLITIITAGYLLAATSPIVAEDKMSAVQLAAAAKLVGRLGQLRGSVKPDDRAVFLTTEMVLPLKKRSFRSEYTGGIPKRPLLPEKSKLPPIVLEMGPEIDRVLENILYGKPIKQAETGSDEIKPFNLQDALTLAQATPSPARTQEIVAFRERATNYLEDYFTPPPRSK